LELTGKIGGLLPAGSLANYLQVGARSQESAEACSHDLVVFDEQQANLIHGRVEKTLGWRIFGGL
jgi:hypothetical protein